MERTFDRLAKLALGCTAIATMSLAHGQFSEQILHAFHGSDGRSPNGELLPGSDGNFYGTTMRGGTNDDGTVFKITANGTFTSLYSFTGGSDGLEPRGRVLQGSDGALYGATFLGADPTFNATVFKLNTDGTGFSVLHSFSGQDGQNCSGLSRARTAHFMGRPGLAEVTALGRFSGSTLMEPGTRSFITSTAIQAILSPHWFRESTEGSMAWKKWVGARRTARWTD